MNEVTTISYAGRHTIDVVPGRALRLSDGNYPVFMPPPRSAVAAPDDCLLFLRWLHLSLLGVFEVAPRRWIDNYFDAVISHADSEKDNLLEPAGSSDVENGYRAWCYAAYRPLIHASFILAGREVKAPIMFWLADGPYCPTTGVPPQTKLLDHLSGVVAPHHPFVRRPLAGLLC
ncbi:MAG: hypothetical protein CL573_01685 [Alphaproteobacteria bacterium]|nr:hypothetical protein [Alphaproteobacteria bacterium]HCP00058.1 hypothetical protein [Rhodospirillaceae bacterium]|tara:strand:+ start:51 stop:572 length:522 start_codon:yes stop_codon:yes gene_type:complete